VSPSYHFSTTGILRVNMVKEGTSHAKKIDEKLSKIKGKEVSGVKGNCFPGSG